MENYRNLIYRVLTGGEWKTNRTAQPSLSLFGAHLEFDLREGFPLLSLKYVPFGSVIGELVGFVRGCTNVHDFQDFGTKVWNGNAESEYWQANPNNRGRGDLGRIYGAQWRGWKAKDDGRTYSIIDQLQNLVDGLINDPFSRRHIVTAWNPAELDEMALPPCHILFQCNVSPDGFLDLMMYQRSADLFLGVPFNIASYAALLMYLGKLTNLRPRRLVMSMGDVHLYENQIEAAHTLLERGTKPLAKVQVLANPGDSLDSIVPGQFVLTDYAYHPAIPVPMVV